MADGESGLLNTGIKVIHHELSEVQPDYSSLPPWRAVGGVGGVGGGCGVCGWGGEGLCASCLMTCGTRLRGDASSSASSSAADVIST